MAEFSKLVITKSGQALLSEILAEGGKLEFSRVCVSDVEIPETELETLETLSQIRQESSVTDITKTSEQAVVVEAAFSNTDLTEGYFMRTLGLFAKYGEKNVLYAAAVETSGHCYMPPYNGVTVSGAMVQLVTAVGNSENVSLEVDPAGMVSISRLNEEFTKHNTDENAHSTAFNTKIDKDDVSNPNLLINPDFKINQRGLTEYTEANTYTVDRWKLAPNASVGTVGKVSITDNSITLTSGGTKLDIYLRQLIENGAEFVGKTVTLSLKAESITGEWAMGQYAGNNPSINLNESGIATATFEWVENSSNYYAIHMWNRSADAVINGLEWVKLEIGSVATQFVAPNPLTEKVKCGIPDDTSEYGYRAIVNADSVSGVTVSNDDTLGLRKIYAGTSDMTAGTSALESGAIYLVYE